MKKFKNLIAIIIMIFLLSNSAICKTCCKNQSNVANIQQKLDYVNLQWWKDFNDPILYQYISRAVEKNHNARLASWRVEEYRQSVKVAFANQLPSLSFGSNYIGAHWPEHIKGVKDNVFVMPIMAKYEADVFLKNYDKTKSSKKVYEASKWEEKGIYILLASDVASAYLNVVKLDKLIELQQKLVYIKKEKFARSSSQFKRGVINADRLNISQKDLESAKNTLEEYSKMRDKLLSQLAVLIDESPENAKSLSRADFDAINYTKAVPDTISSNVIFARPDIMATEAKLEKAKIDIRIARKEFLPTFNLTGFYTMSNLGAASFGSWQSSLVGGLIGGNLDLFKGGAKVANLKINKARYEEMFEEYKQTDLVALKEVNDSLFIIKYDSQIDKNTLTTLNLEKENFNRTKNRYKNGVISYPELLTGEESLIKAEQEKVNSKSTVINDYFTLYKSVGGQL